MRLINDFNIERQEGTFSCWAAVSWSILNFYGCFKHLKQSDLVDKKSGFVREGGTGDPEKVLLGYGALRNADRFNGDEAERSRYPTIFIKIKDCIDRREPVIVNLMPPGGNSIGHAMIIFGYDGDLTLYLKDPSRPNTDIQVQLENLMLGFTPSGYPEDWRYYASKLIFTKKPFS